MHRPCARPRWPAATSHARVNTARRRLVMGESLTLIPEIFEPEAARLAGPAVAGRRGRRAVDAPPDLVAVRRELDLVARADVAIDRRRIVAEVAVVDVPGVAVDHILRRPLVEPGEEARVRLRIFEEHEV